MIEQLRRWCRRLVSDHGDGTDHLWVCDRITQVDTCYCGAQQDLAEERLWC